MPTRNFGSLPGGGFVYRPEGLTRSARDLAGRFTSLQTTVRVAHEAMALGLARSQAEALREAVGATGRPQRATRYLERALVSEGNWRATADGFAVGIEAFLRSTRAAPYYRNLEEGSEVHVGRVLHGLFLTPGGRLEGPVAGSKSAVQAIVTRTVFGSEPDNRQTSIGTARPRGARFVIQRPIPAYHFMRNGTERYLASGAIRDEYRKAFQAAGFDFDRQFRLTAGRGPNPLGQ